MQDLWKRYISIAIILSVVFFYSCSNDQSSDVNEKNTNTESEEVNSDRVLIFEADVDPAYEINFQHEVRFGSTEDRFIMMNGGPPDLMRVDHHGRVFVPDRQQQVIHVFEADGNYLTQLGGQGSGPGEFRQMSAIRIDSDYLYVDDGSLLRINAFSLNPLEFSHTIPLNIENWNHLASLSDLNYTGMFYARDNGELLLRLTSLGTSDIAGMDGPEAKELNRLQYVWFDQQGKPISDPVFEQDNQQWVVENFQGSPHALHLPVHGKPLFAMSDQGKIVSAWSDDFLIKLRTPDGEYLHGFSHSFVKRPLNRDDLVRELADIPMSPHYQAARTTDLPETWPALHAILIDDQDRIWVSTIIDDPDHHEWWITENTGQLLARFLWPEELTIAEIRNGFMYAFKQDSETGERRIDKYRIHMDEY